MALQAIAFYLLAFVTIAAGLLVVSAKNPVHSVLFLITAFFSAAGLFVLLGAEFLAMLLIVVYVGAVAVLFLFVVMMLDIEVAAMRAGFARYLPLGLALAVALLAEVIIAFQAWSVGGVQLAARAAPIAPEVSNIQAIGNLLYTRYLFIFEGAGLVLLVAMIGAIVLTHRKRGGVRPQNIAKQNARQPHEAVRNINQPIGQGVEL